MSHLLLPRLSTTVALTRLAEIEMELRQATPAKDLVREERGPGISNETGGAAASGDDIRRWRQEIVESMAEVPLGSASENANHSMHLGRAIAAVIDPSPSDAAHDGGWSFLSLMVFPDLLAARWPSVHASGELAKDRWIGSQAGRDRNYLKLAWRRWRVFGAVMTETGDPFGEDEFGALLERSSVARNVRLVRLAAREVADYRGRLPRTTFARVLMRQLTALTGPLQLDMLTDEELLQTVRTASRHAEMHGR